MYVLPLLSAVLSPSNRQRYPRQRGYGTLPLRFCANVTVITILVANYFHRPTLLHRLRLLHSVATNNTFLIYPRASVLAFYELGYACVRAMIGVQLPFRYAYLIL
jgi:hypothetical protein